MSKLQMACVPMEPTEEMWGGVARDIIFWQRYTSGTGRDLHRHLDSIGNAIPEWLAQEIPNNDVVPPKGTVAVCIYKAMVEAWYDKVLETEDEKKDKANGESKPSTIIPTISSN